MSNDTEKKAYADLAGVVKTLQDQFLLRTELFNAVAVDLKVQYDALIAAGFTDEQAMQIIIRKK